MTTIVHDDSGRPAWRIAMWVAIAGLLLLPLLAMQFTTEVAWDAADFAAAAAMLVGWGIGVEMIVCGIARRAWRIGGLALLTLGVLLIWADAAVGIL